MADNANHLRTVVRHAALFLAALDESAAGRALKPGGWSPKQVLGHLIDSASVNHQRFAAAAGGAGLVFGTYDQDQFVAAQAPSDVAWVELLDLWRLLNRHVARVMELTPPAVLRRPHSVHNLHEIAFRPLAADQSATLDYLMRDYVEHLLHHLRQIDPAAAPVGSEGFLGLEGASEGTAGAE